ncbi:glycosyltransferase family 2 protein [Arthrobacter sp. MDT3-44]
MIPASVTCVIPTHDRDDQLPVAMASIAAQSRLPERVVVVDDTGSDHTRKLVSLRSYDYLDGSLFPVKGASASRNAGAAASDSEYLAFLDDDDRWEPDFLLDCLDMLASTDADLVAAGGSLEVGGRNIGSPWQLREGVSADEAVAHNPGITGSNFVIRRAVFESLGGFDEQLPVYNDLDFFVRFLRAGHTYAVVERRLVVQSADGGDHLSSRSERRAAGIRTYIDKHYQFATSAQLRRLRRDYHLALRYRGQKASASAAHFALMWANSTPSQVVRVVREKATRGTKQYS